MLSFNSCARSEFFAHAHGEPKHRSTRAASSSDVARLIATRLAAVDVVQSADKISRFEYTTLTLGELLRDDS